MRCTFADRTTGPEMCQRNGGRALRRFMQYVYEKVLYMELTIAGLSCSFGFCPPEICSCTLAGTTLPPLPPTTGMIETPKGKIDYDLCAWTCRYGTCPTDLCKCSGTGCPGSPTLPIVSHFVKNSLDDGLLMKNLNAQGPEGCSRVDKCTIQVIKAPWSTSGVEAASACPGGQVKIGYDHAGCPQVCRISIILELATIVWEHCSELSWIESGDARFIGSDRC